MARGMYSEMRGRGCLLSRRSSLQLLCMALYTATEGCRRFGKKELSVKRENGDENSKMETKNKYWTVPGKKWQEPGMRIPHRAGAVLRYAGKERATVGFFSRYSA